MSSTPELAAVDRQIALGHVWLEKGRLDLVRGLAREALAADPEHAGAHRLMAYWLVHEGDLPAAAEHLGIAQRALPRDDTLRRELSRLRELTGFDEDRSFLEDNPAGRLKFRCLYDGSHHRSGWKHALAALQSLHTSGGVRFEHFLEEPFAWQHPRSGVRRGSELLCALRSRSWETRPTSEERGVVPVREPWVGVWHNPPEMPSWFHAQESPQSILAKPVFRDSLDECLGFFTLSRYLGRWVEEATGMPVSTLVLPTEIPDVGFSFDRFRDRSDRCVVQVGWWLRSQSAIHRLPLGDGPDAPRKLRLIPRFAEDSARHLEELLQRELRAMRIGSAALGRGVDEVVHLPDDEYDALLSSSIVFLQLLDASASNTVVECIARATPLLVNPLSAVVEYLGEDYPFYYDDLEDAAVKVRDMGRVRAAHEYLLDCETRSAIDTASFLRSFEDSEVYQRL